MIKTGLYRHYKGGVYRLLMTAKHTETEEWFVIYKDAEKDGPNYARPYDMFLEKIEVDGKITRRFEYIGE